jgi:hypothetical protein
MHAARAVLSPLVRISSGLLIFRKHIQAQYIGVVMDGVTAQPSRVLRTIRHLPITALYLDMGWRVCLYIGT